MLKKLEILFSCFLITIILSGCGLTTNQVSKTQSFGKATQTIGKISEEEFIYIRNGIIEMNKQLIGIDNTKTSKDLKFDRPTSAKATATRVAAAKALKSYGELLVKLVTEDRSGNLQKVADSFINNTTEALDNDLSNEKKDAINKIIVGLGSLWIEKEKAKAAKKIIPIYEEQINKLADLLVEDFALKEDSKGFIKGYERTATRLENASMRLVDAGSKYSVLERDRAVEALVLAQSSLSRAKEISSKATRALSTLKKANSELVKEIDEKSYSVKELKEYGKQIQELVNMYQVLTK